MVAIDVNVPAFWEHGYQIVRNVYSPEEIRSLREDAYASRGQGRDLLCNPRLRRVLTDGRLVDIARQLLRQEEILYSGDTDPDAPDWQGRYTLLRFGIYLQDHSKHTGGLNLRAKSHNTTSLTYGKNVYVKTRVGDVGVWSLRTTHSGNGTLVRWPREVHPEPNDGKQYAKWRIAKSDGDRIAVFAALGLDDDHNARYVEYLKTRSYMVGMWRKSEYDAEALAEAAKVGLKVRDVPSEVANDPTAGKNEKWEAIPY